MSESMYTERTDLFLDETDLQPASITDAEEIQSKIDRAETALQQCSDKIARALARTNDDFYRALGCVYEVCLAFDDDPLARHAFLTARKVKVHGLCQNQDQPVVKAFLLGQHQECRSAATKIAAALALAKREQIAPEQFFGFITKTTLKGAYARYQKLVKPTQAQKLEAARELYAAIETYAGQSPSTVYEPNSHTAGRRGRALLLADIGPDGSFKILRSIEMEPKQLDDYLAAKARRAA